MFGKQTSGFGVGDVAPLAAVTVELARTALTQLRQCNVNGRLQQAGSLLPTSSVNGTTEVPCRLQRAVSVLATVACGRLCGSWKYGPYRVLFTTVLSVCSGSCLYSEPRTRFAETDPTFRPSKF